MELTQQSPNGQTALPNVGRYKVGVLLLHGLTGMPDEMRPVMRHLTRLGCRVEVPVLPGHGGTHHELLAATWQDWYNCAREAVRDMKKNCDQVFVCGLSMGAIIAALVSLEEDVAGIVMLSSTMHYDMQGPKFLRPLQIQLQLRHICKYKVVGENLYWTENPPYGLRDPRLQKQVTKAIEAAASGNSNAFGLFRTYWGSLYQLWLLVDQYRKHAHRIKCPALVMHSYEDTITSTNNATEAFLHLGSPDKSLILLTGCDHVLTLDLCKDQVAQNIGNFVTRIAGVTTEAVAV
jgi:carboxylesterase